MKYYNQFFICYTLLQITISYCFFTALAIHKHPTTKNTTAGINKRMLFITPNDHHANNTAAKIFNTPLKIYILNLHIKLLFSKLSPIERIN